MSRNPTLLPVVLVLGVLLRRDALLTTKDSRDWRPLIFFAVLISHVAIVLLLVRTARQAISSPRRAEEPLVVMFLHDEAPPSAAGVRPRMPASGTRPATHEPIPNNAIAVPPEVAPQPKIDWEREAELVARNDVAGAEKQNNYRDLSALSAAQLSWVKQNHMEPVRPGIEWQHPRFEFDRHSGLPIFWINDHCVLVTLMVFCGIGHIEANGALFKHMRDP
jgi:hypothetical protein